MSRAQQRSSKASESLSAASSVVPDHRRIMYWPSSTSERRRSPIGVDGDTNARLAFEVQLATRLNTGRLLFLADLAGCRYTGQPVSRGYFDFFCTHFGI